MPTDVMTHGSALTAEALTARVLHRDADTLILDKPPGIAVHKGPGRGDNLEAHFRDLMFERTTPPGLAHRLDKDTSGCLVLGRHPRALAKLNRLFAKGQVEKTYWAIAAGRIVEDAGRIEAPLARRSHDKRSWWMQVSPDGDPSATEWRVKGRADGLVWFELKPLTGRTHQLRVHLAHLGLPIAGDRVYGGDRALAVARHLQLHARSIRLPLDPARPLEAVAPPPAHMHTLLAACGWTA
jgi:RluA family pseudouridine synthase